jgi:RiboL-PSP-HEPN
MTESLHVLEAQLDELSGDLSFLAMAVQLRPRIGDVVRWEANGEVVTLARGFMEARGFRPEGIYGPLLVRLLASVERYTRGVLEYALRRLVERAAVYDGLAVAICNTNIRLTGKLLASLDEPRDHLAFDIERLIENLATCRAGRSDYRLNPVAFTAPIAGSGPLAIERALATVGVANWWDAIGGYQPLTAALRTRGARATGARAKEKLRELWRWRNQIAHGGDQEIALSEAQLQEAIGFVRRFVAALDEVISARI